MYLPIESNGCASVKILVRKLSPKGDEAQL